MENLLEWLSQWGYFGLFGLLILGIIGLPIPDETLLVFSGYLISQGRLHPVLTFGAALLGSLCGITGSYWIGRTAGKAAVLHYGRWIHVTAERLERVHRWFEKVGNWLLTFGYFIPGVRHFTALVAGLSGTEYRTFASFAYPGALVWVLVFLALGRVVGKNWQAALAVAHHYTVVVLVVVICLATVFYLARRAIRRAR